MPLTPDDVRNKQFSTVKFKEGYSEEEVDAFLDEIEAELGRLLAENEELRTRVAALQQQVAAGAAAAPVVQQAPPPPVPAPIPAPVAAAVPSADVVGILEMAQRTANETVLQARAEAQRILAEAQESHRQTMGSLEGERLQLQGRVDDLRTFEREYRTRLKGYLEAQLRDLTSRGEAPAVAAAASPALAPGSPAAPMPPTPAPPQMAPPQAPPQMAPPVQPPAPQQPAPQMTPPPMTVPQVQPQQPQQQNPQPRPAGPFTPAPQPPMPPASRPTVPGQPDQQQNG
jgi:DivIVA domain-containing protein